MASSTNFAGLLQPTQQSGLLPSPETNRAILNYLVHNELATEVYPFLADRPLARLGFDPKRVSFLPALAPTGSSLKQRVSGDIQSSYPALFDSEVPSGMYVPSKPFDDDPMQYLSRYVQPFQQEAIFRWGLLDDPLDRMYMYTDVDDYREDQEALESGDTPVEDQAKTKLLQVLAHESGHRGLQILMNKYPHLVDEIYDSPAFGKNLNESLIRLQDLASYHGNASDAVQYLKENFPKDYDSAIEALKLSYSEPLNEMAKELLEEQGRPAELTLNKDFKRLW